MRAGDAGEACDDLIQPLGSDIDPDLFKLWLKFEEIRVIQVCASHVGVTDLRETLHEEIRNLCKTDHTGSLIPDEDVAGQAAVDPEAHHGAEDVAMREFLGEFFC